MDRNRIFLKALRLKAFKSFNAFKTLKPLEPLKPLFTSSTSDTSDTIIQKVRFDVNVDIGLDTLDNSRHLTNARECSFFLTNARFISFLISRKRRNRQIRANLGKFSRIRWFLQVQLTNARICSSYL